MPYFVQYKSPLGVVVSAVLYSDPHTKRSETASVKYTKVVEISEAEVKEYRIEELAENYGEQPHD